MHHSFFLLAKFSTIIYVTFFVLPFSLTLSFLYIIGEIQVDSKGKL